MRLLVVEDETLLAEQIREHLVQQQFSVDLAFDGAEGWYKLSEYPYDLAVIDIGLPKMDGLALIRKARQNELKTPVIVLTARGSWQEKVEGLDAGADDYLTKPFNPRELTIRARNLLNRTVSQPVVEEHKSVVKFNGWVLDENSRNLTSPEGVSRRLPKGEYRALRLMLDSPGKIFTREQLIRHMTGRELRANDRTVDVTIRRIRKHFESDVESPELISTIHGEGYRFVGKLEK